MDKREQLHFVTKSVRELADIKYQENSWASAKGPIGSFVETIQTLEDFSFGEFIRDLASHSETRGLSEKLTLLDEKLDAYTGELIAEHGSLNSFAESIIVQDERFVPIRELAKECLVRLNKLRSNLQSNSQ